jgi:hypothetical protein
VQAVAAAAAPLGVAVPTCWVVDGPLPRPVTLRGASWSFLVADDRQYTDPVALVDAVREDRRRGDDVLGVLLLALALAHTGWTSALRLTTIAVRPGRLAPTTRVFTLGLLVGAPVAAVMWLLSWVAVQVGRVLVPARVLTALLAVGGPEQVVDVAPQEDLVALGTGPSASERMTRARYARGEAPTRSRARTAWNTPQALANRLHQDLLGDTVRVVGGMLLIGLGVLAGWGRLPAERIVWPWEADPVSATVTAVAVEGDPQESLLGRLGMDVGTSYTPTVRMPDGTEIVLPSGSAAVAVDDVITVVPDPDDADVARATGQDSTGEILLIGAFFVLLALVVHRSAGAMFVPVARRWVAQVDHDQRVLTGRRHRSRRPRALLGIDLSEPASEVSDPGSTRPAP